MYTADYYSNRSHHEICSYILLHTQTHTRAHMYTRMHTHTQKHMHMSYVYKLKSTLIHDRKNEEETVVIMNQIEEPAVLDTVDAYQHYTTYQTAR